MTINLDDFWERDPLSKLKSPDWKKILNLSDKDFMEYYGQLMDTYQDFWDKRNQVVCNTCHKDISGPKDLVRYFGINIHRGECIKEAFDSNKYWGNSDIKKYFQRIVNLTSNLVSENSQ